MKNGTPALIKLMVLLAVSGWASHSLAGGLLSKPNHFFVSPNGNDQWNGRSADVGGTNGPQLSLAAAFNSVRRWRHNGNSNSPAVIWLRGGIYILKEPVTILPEDHDLTIAAVPGEMPVISGGKIIEGWQPAMLNTHSVWVAEVPEIENRLWFFRELWVNDRLATRAREPKTGSLAVESVPDAGADVPWQMGQNKFIWKPGNLKPWAHPNDAEVVETHVWVESHLPVRDIDASSRTLTFAKRSIFKMAADDLWWVEGAPEFLDQPGEWACDRAAGKIYYYPRPGETIGQTTAIAPVLTTLVNLNGDTERKQFINHVTFQGLTFSHAHWLFPHDLNPQPPVTAVTNLEAGGFGQAAIGVTGAVRGQGVVASRFENCRFIHLGGYGLELAGGCRSNVISRCEFGDLGGGGIKIGETTMPRDTGQQTAFNEISDCDIHDGGRVFPSAIGIWIGQSPSNHIDHNVIHDFYYTAISIGWTWGYGEALAGGNVVEYNHIHHIGRPAAGSGPVLSDMGGIYTLGKQPGTRIVNNLWHDIAGLRYGGWGIYFDEGSSGIVAESNIVYNTTHGGFHQHYGETNLVRNNLFANGRDQQIQRTREEDHISFYFTNNMVLFEKEPILAGNWSSHHFVMDGNIYWQTGRDAHPDKLKFAGQIFSEWQLTGHDQHSLVADPRILDFTNGDLRISPDSPAISLGFLPFNLKDVGPRGRLVETSTP
jgi:parallel beta-helix repeat protein